MRAIEDMNEITTHMLECLLYKKKCQAMDQVCFNNVITIYFYKINKVRFFRLTVLLKELVFSFNAND